MGFGMWAKEWVHRAFEAACAMFQEASAVAHLTPVLLLIARVGCGRIKGMPTRLLPNTRPCWRSIPIILMHLCASLRASAPLETSKARLLGSKR